MAQMKAPSEGDSLPPDAISQTFLSSLKLPPKEAKKGRTEGAPRTCSPHGYIHHSLVGQEHVVPGIACLTCLIASVMESCKGPHETCYWVGHWVGLLQSPLACLCIMYKTMTNNTLTMTPPRDRLVLNLAGHANAFWENGASQPRTNCCHIQSGKAALVFYCAADAGRALGCC